MAFLNKLRYDSYTMKFTHLKCTTQWFSLCSQGCATITTIQLENIFITVKRNPVLFNSRSPKFLATINLSISIGLPILDISYK